MYKVLIPLFALALLLVGCTQSNDMTPPTDDKSGRPFSDEVLKGKHHVVLKTTLGDIELELDADAAPKTVTNFISLAESGYYDDLTFHRVIPDFMIQGGDPNGNGTGGESIFGAKFEDEINAESYGLHKKKLREEVGDQQLPSELEDASVKDYLQTQGYVFDDSLKSLPMKYGAIAMANSGPNTNGSQFFIVQRKEGADWLEGKHTVFGKVIGGMEVIDVIANTERDENDMPLVPVTFDVEVLN